MPFPPRPPGRYRDLMVCVAFTNKQGLRIIGEIQVLEQKDFCMTNIQMRWQRSRGCASSARSRVPPAAPPHSVRSGGGDAPQPQQPPHLGSEPRPLPQTRRRSVTVLSRRCSLAPRTAEPPSPFLPLASAPHCSPRGSGPHSRHRAHWPGPGRHPGLRRSRPGRPSLGALIRASRGPEAGRGRAAATPASNPRAAAPGGPGRRCAVPGSDRSAVPREKVPAHAWPIAPNLARKWEGRESRRDSMEAGAS